MTNSILKKKIALTIIAFVVALCISVGIVLLINAHSVFDSTLGAADNNESGRITMSDLTERYAVDYVLGPIELSETKDPDGKKVLTNNKYGIPADKYLDVESYLYTEKDTSGDGRILFGWKSGINVHADGRCALIVPSDVTVIGAGKAEKTEYTEFSDADICMTGVYFAENSRLKNIESGTSADNQGYSAFGGCKDLRFVILPSGVQAIGDYAFSDCSRLVDVNIPSSVKSIGKFAYKNCYEILYLSKPTGATVDDSAFDGCTKLLNDESKPFVFGGVDNDNGRNGVAFVLDNSGDWTAVSLSGATDSGKIVFPLSADFAQNGDRRKNVKYDYVNNEGVKCKNSLGVNTKSVSYNIAANFANGTACESVIIPSACKSIGDNAFYNSHVTYLETHATEIGNNAFAGSAHGATQWLYFHNADNAVYNIAANAFNSNPNERHVVFEDYALYDTYKDHIGMPKGVLNGSVYLGNTHYQIPIVANIRNEDSGRFALKGGDVNDRFFNDADYVANPVVKSGNNAITYTKRLSGYAFDYVKQATGEWAQSTSVAGAQAQPTLSNMNFTYWFADESYSGKATAESVYSPSATSIEIYTKNIAKPALGRNKQSVLRSAVGAEPEAYRTFTFGQEYTIDGKKYKPGDSEDECMDYNAALGLGDDYTVSLKKFTYADGTTDGTSDTTSVRNAGTYELGVDLNNDKWGEWSAAYLADNAQDLSATVRINKAPIDFSTVDYIPAFVNANAPAYKAHGDITSIYRHNDGWYPSQKSGEVPVEIRTITNAYYYETGKEVPIKVANEVLPGNNVKSATSTLVYNGQTLNIKDRAGMVFTAPNEYIATFTFYLTDAQKTNYYFYYGDVTADDEIKDSNKGLSITQRAEDSFVLSKHWFIAKYASLFVATDDTANYPFVPFHDPKKVEEAGGKTNNDDGNNEGDRGETNTATDTVKYTDDVVVKVPVVKFNSGFYDASDKEIIKNGSVKFDIIYTDLDGKKHRIATQVSLDTSANPVAAQTLSYYFNKTMPAGNYTLKLYGEIALSEVNQNPPVGLPRPNKIQGEYWLTVLPKEIDSALVNDVRIAIRGDSDESAPSDASDIDRYLNAYALGENMLHQDISDEIAALDGLLNDTLSSMAGASYWSDLSAADKKQYFDSAVTITYNRNIWSGSNYVSQDELMGMLTRAGTFTFYYSISAKNYVTVGGENAPDRLDYGFRTRLSTGISIKEVYDIIKNQANSYFKDVTYTGEQVHTLVPDNQYYGYSFDDKTADGEENYVNAREKASVTLTIYDSGILSWKNDLPDNVTFDDYFALSADKQKLTVYFDIKPATNSWTAAPQMAPWTYKGFNKDVNYITAMLAFSDAAAYYRIGAKNADGSYDWKSVNGTLSVDGVVSPEYFAVDDNGQIVDDADGNVAKMLNGLSAGTYYLCGYINEIANVNAYQLPAPYVNVFVMKAANSWETTPSMSGWTYSGFTKDNFHAGKAMFDSEDSDISYALYSGRAATGAPLKSFKTIDDEGIFDYLKDLGVGTYTLVASLTGTDDYGALSQSMTFDVTPAENAWKTAPLIVGWVYGEFADGLFTAGNANFGETVYTVETVNADGNVTGNFDDSCVQLSDSALKVMLGELGVGKYNLRAEALATANYGAATQSIRFTVSKMDNAWKDNPPSIEGWVYLQYDEYTNKPTTAQTEYGDEDKIEYVYQYFPAAYENGLWVANGQEIKNIKTANAGNYILTVTADGDDNYNPLVCTTHFVIEKQQLVWQTAPVDRLDWQVNDTDDLASTALVGATIKDITEYTVSYVIDQIEDESAHRISTVTVDVTGEGRDASDLVAALKDLDVGSYRITVSITVGAMNNYVELVKTVYSAVTLPENTWTATLDGETWTWGDFAAVSDNLTKPAAAYGNNTIVYTVRKGNTVVSTIRAAENDNDADVTFDEFKKALAALNTGAYSVTVSIAATDIYSAPQAITRVFVVNQVTTVWDSATAATDGQSYDWVLYDETNAALSKPTIGTPAAQLGDFGKTVTYKLVKTGGTTLYNDTDWDALCTALNGCKAGEYTVTARIGEDVNHTALDYSVTVVISAAANSWTTCAGYGNSEAKEIERYFGDDLSDITFVPAHKPEHGNVVIMINGRPVTDISEFVGNNGVSEYLIIATVAADDEYGSLIDTVRLKIKKTENNWTNDLSISGWTWDDNESNIDTQLVLPVSEHGASASVVVTVKATGVVAFEATVNYLADRRINANDYAALVRRLCALDVVDGGYTITVIVSETDNYAALSGEKAQAQDFIIAQATNSWATNGEPAIGAWDFGGSTAYPSATPTFGKNTVRFTYASPSDNDTVDEHGKRVPAADAQWESTHSNQAGSYWLRAYVPATANYTALVGYYLFNINEGENDWVNMPGVIAWTWNGYDASTNLFSGSARSNQPAKFSITVDNGTTNPDGSKKGRDLVVTDFAPNGNTLTVNTSVIAKLKSFTLTKNDVNLMVVSDEVAKLLNALKPGTYVLTVSIDGGESLKSLTGSTTFTVGKAENSWATGKAPAVSSYTYGEYNNTTSFTYGETVYGTASAVTYKLDGTTLNNAELFVSAEGKAAHVKLQERLATLDAGSYTLFAWVAGSVDGTYSALYSDLSPYATRTFTVGRATNDWKNSELVTQINKAYSEIKATAFDATSFAALYAQLEPIEGAVHYALLNADYTSRNTDSLTYAQLFTAIKGLPAGEYVIRATVSETTTTNYYGIGATDTRLIISTYDNAFTQIPDAITAQWNQDENGNNATVLDGFEIKATYGADSVKYTLNKTTYNTYKELEDAVSALNAGPYNVTIEIAATDDYAGLTAVRMLTVAQGKNSWQNDWTASASLSVASATKAGMSWDWKSAVTWTKAEPTYGKTVYVEIRKANASSALQYVTLDYGVSNGDSAVTTISETISKLDVGDYELIVSAPATVNWAALSDKVEFSITKVTNGWEKSPVIGGATDNKWAYGTNIVPDAVAKYGEVRYEYETESGTKLTSMPTTAGEYIIRFIVDATPNYDGISGALNVKIEKATNRTVANLGVIGWTWGAYDREVNVITGTPETAELDNATVTYSIGTGMGDSFVALPDLSQFTLTANGLVERDGKVDAALRKLTGGTSKENNITYYTVRIHVGETTNYSGFTADNRFAVTGATNTFTTYPTIKPWEVNHWTDELPSAVALYGAPAFTVTGETDGVVYFKGEYRENADGELELYVELNELNLAPKGEYVLTATVKAMIGQYNSPLVGEYRFKIAPKGEGRANHWEELPTIDGWVANIDGEYNEPTGKPLRGLPNFEFYIRNADGTRGQKVDASLTDVVLKKGSKYESDIYIPVEHGDYILVASSKGIPTEEGKSDALAEYEIRVIIDPRPLSFEQELRIPTLLYLGDRQDWTKPTLKPSLKDAEITYVYTNKETGESSKEMPIAAGEYTVTATLTAKYSNSISMSVDFSVKLSPNGWTAAPNIKDWSEETNGNDPVGAASVGTDQIVYTYVDVNNPGPPTTKKPTTEGTYIMYADLDVKGYEPLHAEYRFTIAPAFDTQLVIAAIVLGVIACILAGVVIYFAIRRYKEN